MVYVESTGEGCVARKEALRRGKIMGFICAWRTVVGGKPYEIFMVTHLIGRVWAVTVQ